MGFNKDMNINRLDLPFILFLLVFSVLITIKIIIFNYNLGVYYSDVFIYLINSLNFAGVNLNGNSSLFLSPVIFFCTSLLFRLGYVDITAIYIVTGAFAVFGIIGFYLLLRYNFNKILSLIGSILLFSLSLNLIWLANGTLDVPAVGLSIWTILFFVLSVDKNPKYYFPTLLFFILSIFTRYTAILILPAMIVYFFGKHDIFNGLDNLISDRKSFYSQIKDFLKSKEAKYIIIVLMIILILILTSIIILAIFTNSIPFFYLFHAFNSGFSANKHDPSYSTNALFYIIHFLNFLFANKITFCSSTCILSNPSITSYLVMIITILGLTTGIIHRFKNIKSNKIGEKIVNDNQETFKTKKFSLILKLTFIIILLVSLLTLNKISSNITILLLTLEVIILFKVLKKYEIKNLNLHLMMLTWFLTYLIEFSLIYIKVNRYILTLMPAFIYFFILGLYYIEKEWNYDFKISKHKINTSQILAIILIVIFIFSAFNFTSTVDTNINFNSNRLMSDFLKHYDPDYQNKNIGVNDERSYPWYLQMKIYPISKQNFKSFYDKNLTYYISNEKMDNLTNYHLLKTQGQVYLYERN